MSVREYLDSEKHVQQALGNENPFRWAQEIGSTDPESAEAAGQGGGASLSSWGRGDGSGLRQTGRRKGRWFGGIGSWGSGRQRIGLQLDEIEVKRNDLWEADWEVSVSDRGGLGCGSEAEPPLPRRSWLRRWLAEWL